MTIPLIIHHIGNPTYFQRSAEVNSQYNTVIVLGDETNRDVKCSRHLIAADYETPDLSEFCDCFVNYSTNPADFERRCFERMFILHEFMQREGLDRVFYADSDCVILENIDKIFSLYPSINTAISATHTNTGSICSSVHNSLLTLAFCAKFIEMCKQMYCTKEKAHVLADIYAKHQGPGGICDMTLYGLMCEEDGRIFDLNVPLLIDGELSVFEHNINTGYGWLGNQTFITHGDKKHIVNSNGKCYAFLNCGTPIRLLSLHFSSSAKKFLPNFDVNNKTV